MPRSKSAAAKIKKPPGRLIEMTPKADSIAAHMESVIRQLGEDPTRDGLIDTPVRVEKALKYLTSGYAADPQKIVNGALFDVDYDEVVIVRDIEFFSMCEHHMLPFFGKMHVAYLPDKKVIGLSKIPRLVDAFARRLQIQERLTQQIAQTIQSLIQPRGRGGGVPGAPFLHDDARRRKAAFRRRHQRHAGRVSRAQGNARRSAFPDEPALAGPFRPAAC